MAGFLKTLWIKAQEAGKILEENDMNFYLLFFIIVAAFIWFDTEAVQKYLNVFGFRFHKYKEWKESQNEGLTYDYQTFLTFKYPSFFVELIACPFCLIIWFNLLVLPFVPVITLGANIVFTIFGYFVFKYALRKLNE